MSIEIDNPRQGEATHTSRNRAIYLCQTQQAFITEENKLHLLYREKREFYDRLNSTEAYWWNGSSGSNHMHRPGEVRS
jgi:hypothetical protein